MEVLSMLKTKKVLFVSVIIGVFLAISVAAQNASADRAGDNLATSKITSPPVLGTKAGQSRRAGADPVDDRVELREDRKSTRLNSSHGYISYAVFCLKK